MTDDTEDEATKRARARVGAMLGEKWTIDALLGLGGMAAVYRATHRNGNEVAIKLLHPELSLEPGIRDRFLREGYVANRVKHPGAVTVFDDDVAADGAAFLVMELLEGETLQGRMERLGGRLPADEVLELAEQLLDVLVAAHEKGIVHRDLKPENLFLCKGGALKVLDFGIARLRELSQADSMATQAGSMLGTPVFMAPEQARGRWSEVDARTDLWAVGATMFTLATGRFVHEAETLNEVLGLAMTQRARSLVSVDPSLPAALVTIVDKALEYEASARWSGASEMRAAVHEARRASPEPAVASPALPPHPGASEAGGTLVSAVLAAPSAGPALPPAATLTTARGVSSAAPAAAIAVEPSPARTVSVARLAAAAGVLALLAAGAVAAVVVTRGEAHPGGEAAGSAGAALQAPLVREPATEAPAPALPPAPAVSPGEVVSVDDLGLVDEKKRSGDSPKPAAGAPASAKAVTAPGPVPAAPPAPASAKRPDPFAKRR